MKKLLEKIKSLFSSKKLCASCGQEPCSCCEKCGCNPCKCTS